MFEAFICAYAVLPGRTRFILASAHLGLNWVQKTKFGGSKLRSSIFHYLRAINTPLVQYKCKTQDTDGINCATAIRYLVFTRTGSKTYASHGKFSTFGNEITFSGRERFFFTLKFALIRAGRLVILCKRHITFRYCCFYHLVSRILSYLAVLGSNMAAAHVCLQWL